MKRRRKNPRTGIRLDQQINPLIQLWALRIIVLEGGNRGFVEPEGGFTDMTLAQAIGLMDYLSANGYDSYELDRRRSLRVLESFHAMIEKGAIQKSYII